MSPDRPSSRRRRVATTPIGDNVVLADFGARRRLEPTDPHQLVQPRRSVDPKSWTADTLMETLAMEADSGRLARGRDYYRAGKVISVEVQGESVVAVVAGTQLEPFEVEAVCAPLQQRHREFVRAELLAESSHILSIMSGRKPGAMVADMLWSAPVFSEWRCTCPDRSAMCKHIVAVGYVLAERLVADPQLVLRMRGIDPEEILARHGSVRHGAVTVLPRGAGAGMGAGSNSAGAEDGGGDTRDGESGGAGESSGTGETNEAARRRLDPQEFWAGRGRVTWEPLNVEPGLELGDGQELMAALRTVSFTAVDQLQAFHDLEKCYEALAESEHMFDGIR